MNALKRLPMRRFTTVAAYLNEAVEITRFEDGEETVIGVYTPFELISREVTMGDVKKAIEPDKVKDTGGKLSKGLGDVPGVTDRQAPTGEPGFQPWPKPSQRKK